MQSDFGTIVAKLRSGWQYRWHAAVLSWVLCVVGWTGVAVQPTRYEAAARVHVDTEGILRPLLEGLAAQPNRDQQLAMMTRTLLSRPNLEAVAAAANLKPQHPGPQAKEEMIDGLSRAIQLKSASQNNQYTIVYSDESAVVAKTVVEAVLKMLLEGSAGEQRRDSSEAYGFLSAQITAYEKSLAAAEAVLRDFKLRNPDFQPGRDYFARLSEADAALSAARLGLQEAENRRAALVLQVAAENEAVPGISAPSGNPQLEARIQELRRNLDALRLRLTEEHPDVVSTRTLLEGLERQRQNEIAAGRAAGSDSKTGPRSSNPLIAMARAEADASVASLRARVAEYQRRYAEIRAHAENMPRLEAEFTGLNREYEAQKLSFEKLLARRQSVKISQDADARKGVVPFRIVDPPRVPQDPASRKRSQLMVSAVLLLGVATGFALAFALSQIRPTFPDAPTLRDVTGLTILGTVSAVLTPSEVIGRRKNLYAWAGAYAGLVVAYGGVMVIL
jgi:polysaccharide chain length determinant protein (PEP-CTERM system associated)